MTLEESDAIVVYLDRDSLVTSVFFAGVSATERFMYSFAERLFVEYVICS